MLRPSDNLLGSSRAARRANLRAERVKALTHAFRSIRTLLAGLLGAVWQLLILWGLPYLYLAAAYLALDLPARWLAHRPAWGAWGGAAFAASVVVCLVGIGRALQNSAPIAPVRPRFAKVMLAASWVAALLLTIGDFAS